MATITRDALKFRLYPGNWPNSIDKSDPAEGAALWNAIRLASELYEEFEQVSDANSKDPRLTPEGARAATAEWAKPKVQKLQEELAKVDRFTKHFESGRAKTIEKEMGDPPREPSDIAMLQEIRTWLRSMPEHERNAKIATLCTSGDRLALRAVLTAPSYLTGTSEDQIRSLADAMFKKWFPDKQAKHEGYRKALNVADRAVSGVIELVESETG